MKNICVLSVLFFAALVCLQLAGTCTVQAAYCDGITCVEPTTWEMDVVFIKLWLNGSSLQDQLAAVAANHTCYDLATIISDL